MDLSILIAFAVAATALVWLPGPDWAFVVAAGTRERVVAPAVTGLVIGYVLMAIAVAAGIAPLVAAVPTALVVITVAGASYLIYLGVGILRSSGTTHTAASNAPPLSGGGRLLRRGIGVSALNPKSLVLFIAFLPQFISPQAPWPLAVQLTVLGCVWAAIGAVFYTALGYTAQKALGSRPSTALIVTRIAGVGMILAGAALLSEQLIHALTTAI